MREVAEYPSVSHESEPIAEDVEPKREGAFGLERILSHDRLVAPDAADTRVQYDDALARSRVDVEEDVAAPAEPIDGKFHAADRAIWLPHKGMGSLQLKVLGAADAATIDPNRAWGPLFSLSSPANPLARPATKAVAAARGQRPYPEV